MSNRSRKSRGRETQRIAADYLKFRGLAPYAVAIGAGESGRDILNVPGMATEVKAARDCDVLAALRQAEAYANGDIPWVIERPDGYGPEKVGLWPAHFRLSDAVSLLDFWQRHTN